MTRDDRLRVLVLSRSYPSDVLPHLGLWVERPTQLLDSCCDVRVVAATPWCPPLPDVGPLRQYVRFRRIPRRETRAGIAVERPRFLTGPGTTLYAFDAASQALALRRMVDRIRSEFPFDLIHAHMIYPEGAVAHRLARRYGVPFVVTEHAPWTDVWFRSGRVRSDALAAGRAAASLLAVSTSVRDTIVAHGVDPDRIDVVPIGVDPDRFALGPADARRPDQVLFVGWPNFTKGLDVLLLAMALLAERGSAARLLVAGGALYRHTRIQEEKLRRLAVNLGLQERVTFLGARPHEEVARLMRESAVLVLPSRAESFGAVLIEALASGTPVVATRCGGPEDVVTEDVGVLVPREDPLALAEAIESILAQPGRYSPTELRRYAVSRFGLERVVGRVCDRYRALVENQASP